MHTLIVLFNLRSDAQPAAYEAWAKSTDLPIVRELPSVKRFDVYRSQGLFGSGDKAPYAYVEMIDITDLQGFGADVGTATMARVATEFRTFADHPIFILTTRISEE